MITNNQTICYLSAIAIAMALSVLALVKDILALLTFAPAARDYPQIAVMVKVETTQYSTTSVESSESTAVTVCWGGKRSRLFELESEIACSSLKKIISRSGHKERVRSMHGPSFYQPVVPRRWWEGDTTIRTSLCVTSHNPQRL
ncbi:hypothetical protein F5146DRAFT_1002639 [Armillaria mellea]|nr:hypothetical protein F5146DRAFT_1002639 [Armillaria mellea]